MSLAIQIALTRPRRIVAALGAAGALAWIGSFVLLKAGVTPISVVLLGIILTIGALMQTLSPGTGFASRTPSSGALLPSGDLHARIHALTHGPEGQRQPVALVLLEIEPDQETEPSVLAQIAARRLARAIRHGDDAGQVGPLSFAVVLGLAESDRLELYAAGARLANAVSGDSREGRSLKASFGLAMHYDGMTVASLFDEAADALAANRTRSGRVGVSRRFSRGRTSSPKNDPSRRAE